MWLLSWVLTYLSMFCCRRRYYTTPKSYLDLINLYLQLLQEKRYVWQACRVIASP
jgi:hypothetical protein